MSHHFSLVCALSVVLGAAVFSFGQTTQPSAPRIKLWDTTPGIVEGKDTDTDPTEPTLDIYLPPSGATGAAVIVFPGGGYTHLSTIREGSDVAKVLVSHNIAAFVVRYRHAPRYTYPTPILDGQRAVRAVRAHADEYNIDPRRIGVLGFSAGGHLAASLATTFDAGDPNSADPIDKVSCRPDFAALLYPVITLSDPTYAHKGSRDALAPNQPDLWPKLSPEQHVTRNTPPIFITHATTDRTVPVQNSIMFYQACVKAGVPVELHIFSHGSHGFGLAPTDPALRVWPDLMVSWMAANKWLGPAPK
ncbi:MAG: alpha/beta hydrolase [Tepidisphaeraceae bacterium]